MLTISKDASDFLNSLQSKQFKQVGVKIHSLLRDPFPADAKHLSGHPGFRRIDSGEFRVIYTVSNDIISVFRIGKRNDGEVYRGL